MAAPVAALIPTNSRRVMGNSEPSTQNAQLFALSIRTSGRRVEVCWAQHETVGVPPSGENVNLTRLDRETNRRWAARLRVRQRQRSYQMPPCRENAAIVLIPRNVGRPFSIDNQTDRQIAPEICRALDNQPAGLSSRCRSRSRPGLCAERQAKKPNKCEHKVFHWMSRRESLPTGDQEQLDKAEVASLAERIRAANSVRAIVPFFPFLQDRAQIMTIARLCEVMIETGEPGNLNIARVAVPR